MKRTTFIFAVFLLCGSVIHAADNLSSMIIASQYVTYEVTNDADNPWIIGEEGEVSSTNKANNSSSSVTVNFNCTHPAMLSFKYSVSSETNYDKLTITCDGTQESYYSGEVALTEKTLYFSSGNHTLSLTYSKNGYTNAGNDCGLFRDFQITSIETLYRTIELSAAGTLGTEVLSLVSTLPDMKYLRLKGTVNSTDYETLKNMTGLKALDLKEVNTDAIPASQFSDTGILFITLPESLKIIGSRAFYRSSLTGELTLPDLLEEIGEYAFFNTSVTSAVLPASIKTLGRYAFHECNRLIYFAFSTNVVETPEYFLSGCDILKTVTGCDGLKKIANYCFSDCPYLTAVEGLRPEILGHSSFYNCCRLRSIDLSKTTTIGDWTFYNCDSLKNLEFSSLKEMGSYAFYDSDSLSNIVLSDQLTSAPYQAFYGCSALQEVTLGASMGTIGSNMFGECRNIKKIYCNAPAPPSTNNVPFYSTIPTTATLYVPDYAMVSYKLHDYWSKFTTVETNHNTIEKLTLSGTLELSSNARISGKPDLTLSLNSHFIINGNNAQALDTLWMNVSDPAVYTQRVYHPSTFISRCSAVTATEVFSGVYMRALTWYYLSFPFDVNRADLTTKNGASLAVRYYDGASRAGNGTGSSWKDVPADGVLTAGRGYIIQLSALDWLHVKATAASRNQTFTSASVTTALDENPSESSSDAGWNLVGNPYPAYYDIYYTDYTAPITLWSVNNRTYSAYSIADDELALLPMQAFFVQRPSLVDAITFQPQGRQSGPVVEHLSAIKPLNLTASVSRDVINLTLTDGETEDRTRIVVNEKRNDGYEAECDAAKMMSPNREVPQLYSLHNGIRYAINEGIQSEGRILLGVYIPASGSYTLSAPRADVEIELSDALTGATVNLNAPYEFDADAGEANDRFQLTIVRPTIVRELQNRTDVISSDGGIQLTGEEGSVADIYSAKGSLVERVALNGNARFVSLSPGIYIVKVAGRISKTIVH